MADDPSNVTQGSGGPAGVPQYGGFKVSPDGQGGFPISVPDTREFGQAAQQLGQTSQEVMGQGEKAQDLAIRAQQQADQFQSFDALNKLDQAALDLQTGKDGFQNIHGGDVMRTGPNGEPLSVDYANRLQQSAQSIAGGLANDTQRAQFMAMSKRTVLMFNMSAAEHQQREWNTYQETTYDGAQKQAFEYAKENPTNPLAIGHALDVTAASIRGISDLRGVAPVDREAAVTAGQSGLVKDLIANSIAGNNFTAARDIYNAYGPTGKNILNADDNLAVHSAIEKETLNSDMLSVSQANLSLFSPGASHAGASAVLNRNSGVDPTKPFEQNAAAIMHAEGTASAKGFDTILGDQPGGKNALGVSTPKPLTQMNMGDVYSFQRATLLPASGKLNSTAAGGFQITSQNLAKYGPQLFGADWKNQPFDAQHQTMIAAAIAKDQGYGAWAGLTHGSANTFSGNAPPAPPDVLTYVNTGMAQFLRLHPDATAEQRLSMENMLKGDHGLLQQSYENAGNNVLRAAQTWVVNNPGHNINEMPANLRAALPPEHVEGLVSLAKAMDPKETRQDDPAVVNGILSGAVDITKMSDTDFSSLQGKLSQATFQKFEIERASALKKDFISSQTVDTKTMAPMVDTHLQEMGFNPKVLMTGNNATDPEVVARLAAIRGSIYDRVLATQAGLKRKLTPAEMEDLVNKSFIATAGQNNNPLFGYTAAQGGMFGAPQGGGTYMGDNAMAIVAKSLAARGIKNPTHAQLEQELYEKRLRTISAGEARAR